MAIAIISCCVDPRYSSHPFPVTFNYWCPNKPKFLTYFRAGGQRGGTLTIIYSGGGVDLALTIVFVIRFSHIYYRIYSIRRRTPINAAFKICEL